MILSKLRYLDFFAIKLSFFFRSSLTIKTFTGSAISIAIIFYTIFLVFFLGSELFRKNKPRLYYYRDFTKDSEKVLNVSNFVMGFVFEGANGSNIKIDNNDLFILNSNVRENGSPKKDANSNKITFTSCVEEYFKDFPKISNDTLTEVILKGKCLDLNNNSLKDSPLYNLEYKGVSINLQFNESQLEENYEDFFKIFPIKVKVFYQSYLYEVFDYKNPFKKDLGVFEFKIPAISSKNFNLMFVNIISKRDDGLFFTDLNQTNIFSISRFINDGIDEKENKEESGIQSVFEIKLFFEPYRIVYSRSYLKIQEVISQVVSFSNVGLVFGQLLINLLSKREIVDSILQNRSHHVKMKEKNLLNVTKTEASERIISMSYPSGFSFDSCFKKVPLQKKLNEDKTSLFSIKPSFKGTQSSDNNLKRAKTKKKKKCCFPSKKTNQKAKVKKTICALLEIECLLKFYEELRRLQSILLNKNQLYLFKCFRNFNTTIIDEKNKFDQNIKKNCKEYYITKMQNDSLKGLDEKILELMSDEDKLNFFGKV